MKAGVRRGRKGRERKRCNIKQRNSATCMHGSKQKGDVIAIAIANTPPEWLRQNSDNQNRNEKIVGR
jgi:hypothetical protein